MMPDHPPIESADVSATRVAPDDETGLPLLRSWPAVYFAVTFIFVFWIVVLVVLSRTFR